jgi:hypothetical protein
MPVQIRPLLYFEVVGKPGYPNWLQTNSSQFKSGRPHWLCGTTVLRQPAKLYITTTWLSGFNSLQSRMLTMGNSYPIRLRRIFRKDLVVQLRPLASFFRRRNSHIYRIMIRYIYADIGGIIHPTR